jgi:hypothetical protein
MKIVHRYSAEGTFHFWFYNSLTAIVLIILGLFVSLLSISTMETGQVFAGLGLAFSALFLLFYAHFYSEITTDEEGLLVRFCFWRLRVCWDEIFEIKPAANALLLNTIRSYYLHSTYIVKTRALTPFHRFYGLYLGTFMPSFVVFSNISGFDDLYSSIRRKKLVRKNGKLEV